MVASPFSLCLTSLAYWAGEGVACFIRRAAPVAYLCVLLGRLPCRVQRSYHVPRQSKGTAGCHFVWPLVRTRALRKYNLQAGSHSDFFPMQTRTWKVWENETSSLTYEFVNGNPIFLTCNFLCRPRFSVFFYLYGQAGSLEVPPYSSNIFCEATCKLLEQKHNPALYCMFSWNNYFLSLY
jgi:hypothetical protein